MDYPWHAKLIIGAAVVLLLSSPSASSWRFLRGEWSPSYVALIAIGFMLVVLVDYTASILAELRSLSRRERRAE